MENEDQAMETEAPWRGPVFICDTPQMREPDTDARSRSGLATVREVAADLRVARMTVYRLIKSGALGAIRVGRAFRVPEAELEAYKKRSALGPAEED